MATSIPPPTFSWTTAWQALKILTIVVGFISAQQGIQAFTSTFDLSKLMEDGEVAKVLSAVGMGLVFGAIQGALRAVQILLAIWAGPSIWGYLGPILASAAILTTNAAASFVRIFRGPAQTKTTT